MHRHVVKITQTLKALTVPDTFEVFVWGPDLSLSKNDIAVLVLRRRKTRR